MNDVHFLRILCIDANRNLSISDERIAQDVKEWSSCFGKFWDVIAILPILIGYYTYKSFMFIGWEGPVIIFSFFCLGTVINRLILRPIVRLIFQQERLEGNFRFLHVRFRESTESVAMHRGEKVELQCVNQSFASLLENQIRITHWESLMNCKKLWHKRAWNANDLNLIEMLQFLSSFSIISDLYVVILHLEYHF